MDNSRDRKGALFDKKKSFQNYKKNDEIIPDNFKKRLTSSKIEELELEKIEEISKHKSDLPLPPKFSGDVKLYKTKLERPVKFLSYFF